MALVDYLIERGVLKNPKLIRAFRTVDRKDFVPEGSKQLAYADEPLHIGEGQTISQPWTVAFMLELLDLPVGGQAQPQNIMEIGYGSGWQTALLASTGANVYAVERIEELCKWGRKNVERSGFKNVEFFCQDGTLGLPETAQGIGGFDKIIAAAAAWREIPQAWRDQLKIGGKIAAPLRNSVFEFIKKTGGKWKEIEHKGFAFVPLVGENG